MGKLTSTMTEQEASLVPLPPIELICPWDDACTQHQFPADWKFGGASGDDARVDPRFKPDVYEYYDEDARIIWTSSSLMCDEHAIDYFTNVAAFGPTFNPRWVSVRRAGERAVTMIPWTYDRATDMLTPIAH